MPRRLKYERLLALLLALPPAEDELRLSLAQLEALADSPLPRGVWTASYCSYSTVARKNWGQIGFAASFDRHTHTVLFTSTHADQGIDGQGGAPQAQPEAVLEP